MEDSLNEIYDEYMIEDEEEPDEWNKVIIYLGYLSIATRKENYLLLITFKQI